MEDAPGFSSLSERFARQIQLKELGTSGQEKIINAKFFVVGAGGLGSPALMYLAASGASRITVADPDVVSRTNLSRQLIHTESSIGVNKAVNCIAALKAYNPEVEVTAIPKPVEYNEDFRRLIADADVVLDCSDNLSTRHLVNKLCFESGTPLVFGSAVHFSGQVSVFNFKNKGESACYRCIFDEDDGANDKKASHVGVFSALTGLIGILQASEALKIAAGIGESLDNRLLLIDLLSMKFEEIKYKKRRRCPVCGTFQE